MQLSNIYLKLRLKIGHLTMLSIEQASKQIIGATKLYFVSYSRVVMILFSTGLWKSAFSTMCFTKLGLCLCVLIFCVSVSLFSRFMF